MSADEGNPLWVGAIRSDANIIRGSIRGNKRFTKSNLGRIGFKNNGWIRVLQLESSHLNHTRECVMPNGDWPFDQGPLVAAITTRQVLEDGLPVLLVTHYFDDDSWAFLCGTTDATEDGRVVAMQEAVHRDPTLREIADLPPGFTARRECIGGVWHRFQSEME